MSIWVDADACPVAIREIICRAAVRTKTKVVFVANQYIRLPASEYLRMQQVMPGFDVADNEIVKQVQSGELVITSDIPLASEVIDKGALALNTRGELYTKENIKQSWSFVEFLSNGCARKNAFRIPFKPHRFKKKKKKKENFLKEKLKKRLLDGH